MREHLSYSIFAEELLSNVVYGHLKRRILFFDAIHKFDSQDDLC